MMPLLKQRHQCHYKFISSDQCSTLSDLYKNCRFRLLDSEDFVSQAIFNIKNRKERYLNHLKKGHQCFGFESQEGDIVAYGWLTLGGGVQKRSVPLMQGCHWVLTRECAYIWDCRTNETSQRKGFYREGIRRMVQHAQASGARLILMSCDVTNQASRRGILSAGFHQVGCTRLIVLAGVLKMIFSKRHIHVSWLSTVFHTKDIVPLVK